MGIMTPPCARHAAHGELPERRRQRILAPVVRDAQRALEGDGEVAPDLDAVLLAGDGEHGGTAPRFR
jgi:hypothetical protein